MSIALAAEETGVTERSMRAWQRAGLIPVRHVGHRVLVDATEVARLLPGLPRHRHQPLMRGLAGPPPPAGLVVSWPEVELLLGALRDAAEMRAALWAALGGELSADANMDRAARYALLCARLSIARDRWALAAASAAVTS
jgi:hypothetical protein